MSDSASSPSPSTRPKHVVLAGNPNSGKTTLFNALTGLRAKVGNYPGVTVERKEGRLQGTSKEHPILVLDLPGTYSLSPQSLDEQVSRDVLFHRLPEVPPPDLIVVVVDASNLQRNLYFATQVIELGYPTIVALNMVDVAEDCGHEIDARALSRELRVPVYPLIASTKAGLKELLAAIERAVTEAKPNSSPALFCELEPGFHEETAALTELLKKTFQNSRFTPTSEAILALSDEKFLNLSGNHYPAEIRDAVTSARARLEKAGVDWRSTAIEARYARISGIQERVTTETMSVKETVSDKLDRIFTHKIWGLTIFVVIMAMMFQTIFTFAEWPMTLLEEGFGWIGQHVGSWIAPGPLNDLLVNGVVNGVGAVVVFLPQICLLFLFIGLLEDTGYMARAAFLMDRLMSKVGLHGKSFIPMLSSFACAIPGIMATRTIESPKDRLVTILVAPLMSCSARLPVYTLLIAACIPHRVLGNLNVEVNLGFNKFNLFGFLGLPGLTMLGMYLLGIVVALLMAWLFKKTLLKGPTPMLIMELPPYKRPVVTVVLRHMWDRAKLFLKRAGTVILGINILLWFLATYPKDSTIDQRYDEQRKTITSAPAVGPDSKAAEEKKAEQLALIDKAEAGDKLRHSFAGRLGHLIEPLIKPLGFDWKIGIGIVSSFAAREVFVSTMSLVYNVGEADDSDEGTETLAQTLREQTHPDGSPVYTPLVGVTLMVFYVFALQCVSTIVVVRREANGWKWAAFQWLYMGALAWILAFATYHGGRWLGWG